MSSNVHTHGDVGNLALEANEQEIMVNQGMVQLQRKDSWQENTREPMENWEELTIITVVMCNCTVRNVENRQNRMNEDF